MALNQHVLVANDGNLMRSARHVLLGEPAHIEVDPRGAYESIRDMSKRGRRNVGHTGIRDILAQPGF